MTTQNQSEKDAPVSTSPQDDAVESSAIKRELTDEEIVSVAGGFPHSISTPAPVYPPANPSAPVKTN